jgi:hypothetical protein
VSKLPHKQSAIKRYGHTIKSPENYRAGTTVDKKYTIAIFKYKKRVGITVQEKTEIKTSLLSR